MGQNEIAVFRQAIETCEDPAELARKVKLAFKRMPGEMALARFARVMTAELPHPIKVAVWDAVQNVDGFACPKTVAALLERRRPACGQAGTAKAIFCFVIRRTCVTDSVRTSSGDLVLQVYTDW